MVRALALIVSVTHCTDHGSGHRTGAARFDLAAVASRAASASPVRRSVRTSSGAASTSTLASLTDPARSRATCSSAGLTIRHGPHQVGPQIDQYRQPRSVDDLGERVVVGAGDPRQRLVAVPAARYAVGRGRDTVALSAVRARSDFGWCVRGHGVLAVAFDSRPRGHPPRHRPGSRRRGSTSPASSARPMRVSTSREMNRRSGRAP